MIPLPEFLAPTFDPWVPDPARPRSVAVLMSGGVDSSVTALLLQRAGWNVVGVTMRIPQAEGSGNPRPCCGWEAANICRSLEIPHYFLDTAEAFEQQVIAPFRRAYACGQTPNPCIVCNTVMKFRLTLDAVQEAFGIPTIATGHYARIAPGPDGNLRLMRSRDRSRDQSYFLHGILRDTLGRIIFPLGDWHKSDVRAFARSETLSVAERAASMDLCFAGEGDYRAALAEVEAIPGPIVDTRGGIVGQHRGIANFTLGQRRGLNIASTHPLYVLGIDAATHTVTVGTATEGLHHDVAAREVNILIPERFRAGEGLAARIRSCGAEQPCTILAATPDRLEVRFAAPVFAPAPGQALVLYDDNGAVVAGGTITAEF